MPKFTVFRIGDETFGIQIEKVLEILRVQKLYSIPGLPDFLSGVMSVRGMVIPVMDLRKRFDTPPAARKERIILVKYGYERIGFLVDEVKEIVFIPDDTIRKPPAIFKGFKTEYIVGLAKKDDNIIILLNIDNLLTSEEKIRLKESIGNLIKNDTGIRTPTE